MNDKATKSVRGRVARALDWLGLLDRLLWLRARLDRRSLLVFTYHRVGTPADAGELDPALFEVEPAQLAAHLDVIKSQGTIVSLSDLRRFRAGKPLPPNPVIITFDDGYVDNHDVALPILKRASAPATFFVATAFPESGRLFWWDRVALIMNRCKRDHSTITYPSLISVEPGRDAVRAAARICKAVKRTPSMDLPRLWAELEQATGVVLSPEEERKLAARTIMSWAEVRALADAGMEIQSHSHDHLVLNMLPPSDVDRDLARSADVLRETVGREVHSIAYPVGNPLEGAERRAPVESRFKLGLTNDTGICRLDRFDPYDVPRVSMALEDVGALHKLLLLEGGQLRRKPPERPSGVVSAWHAFG